VLVAALGDSITAGSPAWDPRARVRARLGAPPDPKSQYEYWAEREAPALEFRNCGVFGERTDQIATRLDRCARGASVLIVQGGINDVAQGRAPEEAAADLERIVRRGKRTARHVLLVEVLPWTGGHPRADGPIRKLNALIHAIGRRESVPVLPWHDALEDPSTPGAFRNDLTADGDHPSVAGYRILGRIAGQRLRALAARP
jgi:lysophospholipase L1-like esterase